MVFAYYCPECESELEYEIEMIDDQQVLSGPEDCGNCGLDIEDDEVMDEYLFMLEDGE